MHLPQTGSFLFPPSLFCYFLEAVIVKFESFFTPSCQCSCQSFPTHTPVFVKGLVIVVAAVVILLALYSLDLVGHHHRVLFADLGGGLCLVVIGAVVLIGVPVEATEQVATATVKPWWHKGQRLKAESER